MLTRAKEEQSKPEVRTMSKFVWKSFLFPEHDLSETAHLIKQPCLLVFNKKDLVIGYNTDGKIAARSIPHATLAILQLGHVPFAEDPSLFLGHLHGFLSRLQ